MRGAGRPQECAGVAFPGANGPANALCSFGVGTKHLFFHRGSGSWRSDRSSRYQPVAPISLHDCTRGGAGWGPAPDVSVRMAIAAARTGVSQRGASGCLMHVALAGYSGTGPTSCSWTIHRCASIARTAGMDWAPREAAGRVLFPFHVGVQLIYYN